MTYMQIRTWFPSEKPKHQESMPGMKNSLHHRHCQLLLPLQGSVIGCLSHTVCVTHSMAACNGSMHASLSLAGHVRPTGRQMNGKAWPAHLTKHPGAIIRQGAS